MTTKLIHDFQVKSSALGLRLDYQGTTTSLTIEEAASPQRGYGFWSDTLGTNGPVPPTGEASLLRDGCETVGTAQTHPVWQAQLHKSGLFITIRSPNRSLVIKSARALAPIP